MALSFLEPIYYIGTWIKFCLLSFAKRTTAHVWLKKFFKLFEYWTNHYILCHTMGIWDNLCPHKWKVMYLSWCKWWKNWQDEFSAWSSSLNWRIEVQQGVGAQEYSAEKLSKAAQHLILSSVHHNNMIIQESEMRLKWKKPHNNLRYVQYVSCSVVLCNLPK